MSVSNHQTTYKISSCIPSVNPLEWFFVNTFLVAYSTVLCMHIVLAIRNVGERPAATASYLIYNFATTVVWCLEAGLESWHIIGTTSTSSSPQPSLEDVNETNHSIDSSRSQQDTTTKIQGWTQYVKSANVWMNMVEIVIAI